MTVVSSKIHLLKVINCFWSAVILIDFSRIDQIFLNILKKLFMPNTSWQPFLVNFLFINYLLYEMHSNLFLNHAAFPN